LVIPKISDKYFRDFVRGYFDGDGNVWTGFIHKERKTKSLAIQTVFTSCSSNFLSDLKDRLSGMGIHGGNIIAKEDRYYKLQYSIINSLKLYDFMYNHNIKDSQGLYLERKKKVFEKFKSMRL